MIGEILEITRENPDNSVILRKKNKQGIFMLLLMFK